MESTSIFDQFPVTLGDSEEGEEVTAEWESQVSRATDQTAAGQEEDCPEEEGGGQQQCRQQPRDVKTKAEPKEGH